MMLCTETVDSTAPVPSCPIDPEVDSVAFPRSHDVGKYREKSIRVSVRCAGHAMASMHRIDPSENIQPLLVLTARGNHRLLRCTTLPPHSTQLRMKAKSCLILEEDDLLAWSGTKGLKFFLTQSERFSPPSMTPERIDRRAASRYIPVHAITPEPDAHECSRHGNVSDIPPQQDRPSERVGYRSPWGTLGVPSPDRACTSRSSVKGDQGALGLRPSLYLLRWHVGSTLRRSTATAPTAPRPGSSAIPRGSATARRYEYRPRLPEQSLPTSRAFPASLVCSLFEVRAYSLLYRWFGFQPKNTEGFSQYQLI